VVVVPVDCTLVVMVVQGGVEVFVTLVVIVGMLSTLLQKGVATFCACMMLTISVTNQQVSRS
jgi:hypothetical protein